MKRLKLTLLTVVVLPMIASCGMKSNKYSGSKANGSDYVIIVDHSKINAVERAKIASASNVRTIWVNPPVKRVKKSELEKSQ